MITEPFNHLVESLFEPLASGIAHPTPAGLLLMGLVIGLRHALEADHVAAVSTVVATSSKRLGRAPLLGALWGVGHTIALFVAGMVVLLMAVSIPAKLTGTLEFGVGVMLVYLGATALTGFSTGRFFRALVIRDRKARHSHRHMHEATGIIHSHDHSHDDHRHSHRSLIVGMIHGMAGSGALMLAVLSTIDSIPLGLAYTAIFGAGSVGSMAAMSLLIGLPFARTGNHKFTLALRCIAAAAALAIGLSMIYELALVEQVFA